jgi:hypothetical protein
LPPLHPFVPVPPSPLPPFFVLLLPPFDGLEWDQPRVPFLPMLPPLPSPFPQFAGWVSAWDQPALPFLPLFPPLPGEPYTGLLPSSSFALEWDSPALPGTHAPEPGTLLLCGAVLLLAGVARRFLPSSSHSVKGERTPRIFTSMQ